MSFTPLPKTFTDFFASLETDPPRVLELGCGDGRFREVLGRNHISSWGLDRVGPVLGTVADVVGDAMAPPVAPASLDLLVVPNLLRHLLAATGEFSFLKDWLRLLRPGGALFIFEDEPSQEPAGAACYRDLQEFLRKLMPESRGSLMTLEEFRSRSAVALPGIDWTFGKERNREPLDAEAVLGFLDQGGDPAGEPGRLMKSIRRDGLDPGEFWWAQAIISGEEVGL